MRIGEMRAEKTKAIQTNNKNISKIQFIFHIEISL